MRQVSFDKGFTLIELMIVVAIIGILASVAVPYFSGYIVEAKTTEGIQHLKALSDGAVTYFNTEHVDPVDPVRRIRYLYPESSKERFIPVEEGRVGVKYDTHAQNWQVNPWRDLGFETAGSFYYRFSYFTTDHGEQFEANAWASFREPRDSHLVIRGFPDGRLSPVLRPEIEKEE